MLESSGKFVVLTRNDPLGLGLKLGFRVRVELYFGTANPNHIR